eukprot:342165-Chlamydomonas_euryale.AAC.2
MSGAAWRGSMSALQLLSLNLAGFRPLRSDEAEWGREFHKSLVVSAAVQLAWCGVAFCTAGEGGERLKCPVVSPAVVGVAARMWGVEGGVLPSV